MGKWIDSDVLHNKNKKKKDWANLKWKKNDGRELSMKLLLLEYMRDLITVLRVV